MATSDSSAHNTIQQKIAALKAEIATNSISPERMGTILDELAALSEADNKAMISQELNDSTDSAVSPKAVKEGFPNLFKERLTQTLTDDSDKAISNAGLKGTIIPTIEFQKANKDDFILSETSNSIVLLNGNIASGYTGHSVYKVSGPIIDRKRRIFISTKEAGNGFYLIYVFNSENECVDKIAYVGQNDGIITRGISNTVINLSNYDDVKYLLLNSDEEPVIYVSKFESESYPSSIVRDVKSMKEKVNLIENKSTESFSWELYRTNKLLTKDGAISPTDYEGFNIYKLSGDIVNFKKKILLNNVYNGGLGLYLVGIYDNEGMNLGMTGWMDNDNGISRGYNDIVVDLSFSPQYTSASYLLVCISGNTLPEVAVDRYNNLKQMYSDSLESILKNKNKIVVKKDGTKNIDCTFTTIREAVEYANKIPDTTIYIEKGDYDIIAEFGYDYLNSVQKVDNDYLGLQLGNNIRIIGNGSGVRLIANYDGANDYTKCHFSIFNVIGSFHIENLELVAKNIRYCVHEDSGIHIDYTGYYKNIKMTHKGTDGSYTSVACIGGGTVGFSVTTIENCEFYNDFDTELNPVSYHNNYNPQERAKVILLNSYFHGSQTFQTWVYQKEGSIMDFFIAGNKLGSEIKHLAFSTDKVSILEFNNVIKDSED